METLTQLLGIQHPIIGGAMYPCSNPELVAAVSNSGGIGIVQPISLTLVHGYEFRAGLRYIKELTDKPIGLNLLVEKSSKKYLEKNQQWLDIALEEGVRFFITALGNPQWVVEKVASYSDAQVFHDVTNKHWADKAVNAGVDGLICVNNRAGGHAGDLSPEVLHTQLRSFDLPLICAGGIGGPNAYQQALKLGYQGVQIGTRFVASTECSAHSDYKHAILNANEDDIILTEKITGVPVSVIKTDFIKKRGIKPGAIAHFLLHNRHTKHWTRMFYSIRSIFQLKKSLKQGSDYKEYYQAGKSVAEIKKINAISDIIDELTIS